MFYGIFKLYENFPNTSFVCVILSNVVSFTPVCSHSRDMFQRACAPYAAISNLAHLFYNQHSGQRNISGGCYNGVAALQKREI